MHEIKQDDEGKIEIKKITTEEILSETVKRIMDRIEKSRDPEPCADYIPVSKHIELCSFCGWRDYFHQENK